MSKLCKQCWNTNENALLKLCKQCYYEDKIKNPTKWYKAIKKISNKNKNTIAKFTTEAKAQILIRDKSCILCSKWISDYHHIYYWWQAEHWEDRNNVNKWVWLCKLCHHNIHHWITWLSQELRQKCIDYINNL